MNEIFCTKCGSKHNLMDQYCSVCGGSLNIKENRNSFSTFLKSTFVYQTSNKQKGIYIIWVMVHLICLVLGRAKVIYGIRPGNYFYPFDGPFGSYDYSEFIVYAICPLIIFTAWKLIKRDN